MVFFKVTAAIPIYSAAALNPESEYLGICRVLNSDLGSCYLFVIDVLLSWHSVPHKDSPC